MQDRRYLSPAWISCGEAMMLLSLGSQGELDMTCRLPVAWLRGLYKILLRQVEITILAPSPAPLLAADQEPEAGSLWMFAIRLWDGSIAISMLLSSSCVRLLWRSTSPHL